MLRANQASSPSWGLAWAHGSREPAGDPSMDGWHLDRSRTCRHDTLAVARARRQTDRARTETSQRRARSARRRQSSHELFQLGLGRAEEPRSRFAAATARSSLVSGGKSIACLVQCCCRLVWRWEEGNRICVGVPKNYFPKQNRI